MTPEEKNLLAKRIAKATAAEHRIAKLAEAIKAVASGEAKRLNILIGKAKGDSLMYSTSDDESPRWLSVCWRNQEEGIVDEINSAVREILNRRLTAAQKELDEA